MDWKHWWNSEIANARKDTLRAKRIMTQLKASANASIPQLTEAIKKYKEERKILRQRIRTAKQARYDEMLVDLDRDPGGAAYKSLVRKRTALTPLKEEEALDQAKELFPTHEKSQWNYIPTTIEHPFSSEELKRSSEKVSNGIPDGIPPEVIKVSVPSSFKQPPFQTVLSNRVEDGFSTTDS